MKIDYSVDVEDILTLPKPRGDIYKAAERVLSGEKENVVLTFETAKEAAVANLSVRRWLARYKHPLKSFKRNNMLFILRVGEAENG